MPFPLGLYGDVGMCSTLFCFKKSVNSELKYCLPQSVTICFGVVKFLKYFVKIWISFSEVILLIIWIFENLEKLSVIVRMKNFSFILLEL